MKLSQGLIIGNSKKRTIRISMIFGMRAKPPVQSVQNMKAIAKFLL